MNFPLALLILMAPALIAMGLARLVGITSSPVLLLAACLGGAITGAFLASAASAMATAVDPNQAALRTAGVGVLAGLISGGVVLLIRKLFA